MILVKTIKAGCLLVPRDIRPGESASSNPLLALLFSMITLRRVFRIGVVVHTTRILVCWGNRSAQQGPFSGVFVYLT